MGDGDTGISRGCNSRGHTRHHLHGNAPRREVGSLFSTATKQKGIPSLEAHDAGMALSELHQHSIRARLGNRMMTATFAHEVTLTAFGHQIEHLLRHQRVVDQSVAASQEPMGLAGE